MLVLILLSVLFLVSWLYLRRGYWSSLGVPEVRGLPLFGNLLPVVLQRKPYFQLQEEIYNSAPGKPYVGMYNLTVPTLIVRDPVLLERMIRDESRNFEDHGLVADPSDPLSMNIFYLKGKMWKWMRSKLRASFSTSGMKSFYPEIQRCVDNFLGTLGGTLNLRPAMDDFTCEVFSKAVFSVGNKEGFVEACHGVYNLSGLSAFRVLLRMFFPNVAIALGIKVVPQSIEDFFRNALNNSVRKPGSFLDLMLQLKEDEPDFNDDILLAQFFIFIFAGFETTATAMTFCLYNLGKYPEIQEKARREVQEVTKNAGKSLESHKEMVYLDCIIHETLRLYPPVGSMVRVCERPFRLPCGATLPAGSPVVIPYLGLHRDPLLWSRPTEFLPGRWAAAATARPTFFYPFGLGPRNCLGMKFALLEMKEFMSSFLLKYKIKLDPTNIEPLEFEPNSFFIVPKQPVFVSIEQL